MIFGLWILHCIMGDKKDHCGLRCNTMMSLGQCNRWLSRMTREDKFWEQYYHNFDCYDGRLVVNNYLDHLKWRFTGELIAGELITREMIKKGHILNASDRSFRDFVSDGLMFAGLFMKFETIWQCLKKFHDQPFLKEDLKLYLDVLPFKLMLSEWVVPYPLK